MVRFFALFSLRKPELTFRVVAATEALALLKMNAVARKRWIAANLPPLPTTVSSAPPPPLNNRHNSLPPLRVSPLRNRQPMLSPPPITLPPRAEAAAPLSTSPAIYHPPPLPSQSFLFISQKRPREGSAARALHSTKRDSQRRSRSWDEERFAPLSKRRGGDLEERDERSRRPPPPRRSSSAPIKAPLRTGSSPSPLNAESTSEWGRNRDVPFGEASVALPYGQDDDLFGSYRHSTVANDKSHSTSEVGLSESQGSVEEGEVCEENKPRRDSGVAFVSPEPEVKVEDQEQGLEEQEQELEPKAMVVKLEFEVDEPEEAQMAKVDIPRSLPPPSPFLAPATEPEVPNIFALPPLLKVQPASSPDKPVIDASSPDKFDAASSLLTLSRLSTFFSASTSRSNSSPYPSPEPSPPPASHPAKVARSKLSSPTPSSSHTIFPGSALTESPLGEDNPFAGIFGVGSRAASSSSAATAPIARPVSIFAPQPSKKRASTWDKALKPRRGSLKRKAAEDAGEGEEGGQGRRKKKVNWAPDDLLAVARVASEEE